MNRYPPGNHVKCRFYFALRTLTPSEEAIFKAGEGLPSGAGYDPPTVQFSYTPPEGSEVTGAEVIHDGTGAYHAVVPALVTWEGTVSYFGTGLSEGKPFVVTRTQTFTVGS